MKSYKIWAKWFGVAFIALLLISGMPDSKFTLHEITISGKVTSSESGEPLEGILVLATMVYTNQVEQTYTNENGDYTISGLVTGIERNAKLQTGTYNIEVTDNQIAITITSNQNLKNAQIYSLNGQLLETATLTQTQNNVYTAHIKKTFVGSMVICKAGNMAMNIPLVNGNYSNIKTTGNADINLKSEQFLPTVLLSFIDPDTNYLQVDSFIDITDEPEYTVNVELDKKNASYTVNFRGKAFNGPATQRIKNVNNALTAINEKGEKTYINLDNNGEFNVDINVQDLAENITITTNPQAIPNYSRTFSITKSNEEYPINRGLGEDYSTCDWTNPEDTAVHIQAQLLDDDYNNISIIEKKYAEDDTIQYALKDGTVKYEPTTPLDFYIYTKDIQTGEQITATQQQIYEEQMTKARGFLNLQETGPVIPTTQQTSNILPSQYAKTVIFQQNGDGYWNGIEQGSEIGYIVGSFAHTDDNAAINSTLSEIMGRYFRPGSGQSEQIYAFKWTTDMSQIIGISDKGKLEINMQENWEPQSGKQ